jgi:hypothetical protein
VKGFGLGQFALSVKYRSENAKQSCDLRILVA